MNRSTTHHWSIQFFIFIQLIVSVFIAEGGHECLTDKQDRLQDCFNKSMKNIIPNDFSLENLSLLMIGESECNEFTTLQHCLVKQLETCKDNTSANLMKSLFKFIRKTLPCSTERQALPMGDGGPRKEQYFSDYVRDKRQTRKYVTDEILDRTEDAIALLLYKLNYKCQRNSEHGNFTLNDSYSFFSGVARGNVDKKQCDSRHFDAIRIHEKFLVDLKWCLTDEEDFLPGFLRDALNSAADYLCENLGQPMDSFTFSRGIPCSQAPLNRCLDSMTGNKIVAGEVIFEKSTVCKCLQSAHDCIISHCSMENIVNNMTNGVFKALQAPCSGSSLFLNNALLAVLILFYFRKLWC